MKYGYLSDCLNHILFDPSGRPFLDQNIDFNLSHSGEYVICSITDEGKVGIDIERVKPINLSDFEKYLTSKQWVNVNKAADRYKYFYWYWTIKESVSKADGGGLSIPLEEIDVDGKKATLFDNIWFLSEVNFDPAYSCHLATNIENPKIHMGEIDFE